MGGEIRFACPVASRCGGCQMAHLPYAEQLRRKQAWVRELLSPFCPVEDIVGMENPFHYRNKTHAVLAGDRSGNVISGVYRMGTHQVVPVDKCLIQNEKADAIIATVRRLLREFKIRPYREDARAGLMRHILIRTARATGQILVVLVAVQPILPRKNDFVRALLAAHPEITSVVLNVNDRATSMVLGKRDIVLYGPGTIEDVLCGKTFRISPQSFYQVNSEQTERLYARALDYAGLQGTETVLDAYCGIGTIGLCAADRCARLIGVELNPAAVKDATWNAAGTASAMRSSTAQTRAASCCAWPKRGSRSTCSSWTRPAAAATRTSCAPSARLRPSAWCTSPAIPPPSPATSPT